MANKIIVKRSSVASNVPATSQIDLGEFAINTNDGNVFIKKNDGVESVVQLLNQTNNKYLTFNPSATGVPTTEGTLSWNNKHHALNIQGDVPGSSLQVGQEEYIHAYNNTGSLIANGKAVYYTGGDLTSDDPTIALAISSSETASKSYVGITTNSISDITSGFVVVRGLIHDINTTTFTAGDILYLSSTIAGNFQNTRPVPPNYTIPIGVVLTSAVSGTIMVDSNRHTTSVNSTISAVDSKNPTGWVNNDGIVMTYNSTTRTVTLTGDLRYQWRAQTITLASPWTSPAHSATTDVSYFLYSTDGVNFAWTTTPWAFTDLLVAYANYGVTNKFALRELHATMAWQTHEEFHTTVGTYRSSGGTLSGYTLASTTATDRRPLVSSAVIKDEDVRTNIAALSNALYNKLYLTGAGAVGTFTSPTADIVPLSVNQPYYNQLTGGAWQQTLMTDATYMSVWLIGVPTTTDTDSANYRYLWLQGQSNNASLAVEQNLFPTSLNTGSLTSLFTEFVFLAKVIIQYTGGNWNIVSVDDITGTRASTVSSGGAVYLSSVGHDATLSGSGTIGDPLSVLSAGTSTSISLTDRQVSASHYLPFSSSASGSQNLYTDAGITYNPNSNVLTTTTFSGDLVGNVNKVTITPPVTSATLTIANGVTLSAPSNASVSGTNTGDNATNTQYSGLVSNVTTNLSEGISTLTTVDVNSSDGTNATLVSASTLRAGLLTKAKFDEIVANTLKISNVTTNLSEGTSTLTTVDVNSSDGTNATLVSASTTRAGLLTKAKWDEIVANTIKVSNVTTNLGYTAATSTGTVTSSDGTNATLPAATISLAGLLTGADKAKLDSVSVSANNYTHPTNHPPSIITQDTSNRFVTDTQISDWDSKAPALGVNDNYVTDAEKTVIGNTSGTNTGDNATNTLYSGLVSNVTTNLDYTAAASTGTVTSSDGTDATIPAATTSLAGLLTGADKTKLDSVSASANNYIHPANHPPSIITQDTSNRFVTDSEKSTWNSKAPALGIDDNYVTDSEKTVIGNTSGTNTGDNATNTLYSGLVSNVTTNLSEGTATLTTVDVNSSDGTNATLVSASTTRAGLLTKTKFDEIVANSIKVSNVTTNISFTPGTISGPICVSSDGADATIPSASATASGIVTTGNQTFAGTKTFVAPVLGTPTSGNLANCTFPTLNQDTTGNASTATTAVNSTNSTLTDDTSFGSKRITFGDSPTGSTALRSSAFLLFNPGTQALSGVEASFTNFYGALNGNADSATTSAALTGTQATAITDNTSYRGVGHIPLSLKGAINGVAELDATGFVVTSQLPSYVDDVLTYANLAALPATGESGKIYVVIDTNLTYRWSGAAYTEISASLALGETSATAYRGDRGKLAYDHSLITHAPSGATINSTDAFLLARVNHTGTQLANTISDFDTEVANNTAVDLNTAKLTNVTTNLSEGTSTLTTVDVNSSDGTNATLVSASTSRAGLLTKTKFDEIVANSVKVSNVTTNISWTPGTTAGPVCVSSDGTDATIPSASATASGIVTTTTQTFAGTKTFSGAISASNLSNTNSGDNATNTLYSGLVSNVTTNLSEGTATLTTVDVNSSDGTNATLVSASTTRAGLLTKAKFDEIVANTLKVSNVTTNLSKTSTTTDVTINSSDGTNVAIGAASTSVAGVMTKAVFDEHVVNNSKVSDINHNVSTNLSEGTATLTTVDVNSSDGTNATLLSASTTRAGLLTKVKYDEIVANTSKVSNVTTNLSKTATTLDVTINSSDGTNVSIGSASTSVAGVMTKAIYDAHVLNNAKVTNVTTNLSEGTSTLTTVDVNSSDGTNATLVSASTSRAGLLSKAKFDEIVANTLKVSNVTTNISWTPGTTAGPVCVSSDGSDATIPSASATASGIVTTGTQTFSGTKTLVAPVLGTPTSGNLANCTFPTLNQSTTGNAATATKLSNILTTFSGKQPVTVNVSGVIYSHANLTFTGLNGLLETPVIQSPKYSGTESTGVTPKFEMVWNDTEGSIDFNFI